MSDALEPLSPRDAVELYLDNREPDLSEKSLVNQRYRLNSFVAWADEYGLENMNDLTGRDIHRFRVWRRNGEGDDYEAVSKVTLQGILATLRTFLEFCAGMDAAEEGLREKVMMPNVSADEESADEKIGQQYAEDLLRYLERFEYASRDHIIIAILWHTGIRLGTLRAFDVDDFEPENRALKVRHRPEHGTPLKNRGVAERSIAVGDHYTQVIQDYIEHNRHDVIDEHGREPLITSQHGRLTEAPIRQTCYRWTRPCMIEACPHDEDPETCEWRVDNQQASGCPSSRSPHGVRRGAITKHLRDGTPEEVVSDRMNVSRDVLDRHDDPTVTIFAGKKYVDPLVPDLESEGYEVLDPLRGLIPGQRMSKLDDMAEETEQATLVQADGGRNACSQDTGTDQDGGRDA